MATTEICRFQCHATGVAKLHALPESRADTGGTASPPSLAPTETIAVGYPGSIVEPLGLGHKEGG
jgi:hypothetical protein